MRQPAIKTILPTGVATRVQPCSNGRGKLRDRRPLIPARMAEKKLLWRLAFSGYRRWDPHVIQWPVMAQFSGPPLSTSSLLRLVPPRPRHIHRSSEHPPALSSVGDALQHICCTLMEVGVELADGRIIHAGARSCWNRRSIKPLSESQTLSLATSTGLASDFPLSIAERSRIFHFHGLRSL